MVEFHLADVIEPVVRDSRVSFQREHALLFSSASLDQSFPVASLAMVLDDESSLLSRSFNSLGKQSMRVFRGVLQVSDRVLCVLQLTRTSDPAVR